MDYRKTDALTLTRNDYRETSQIVTFYTRNYGKLRALAKGSKRPKNKFDGPFDRLNYGQIVFIYRPLNQMQILTECKVRDNFAGLRRDYGRIQLALYLTEFLNRLTEVSDENPALFDLAIKTLRELGGGIIAPNLLMTSFSAQALKYLGYMPHNLHCIRCENPSRHKVSGCRFAGRNGEVFFSLQNGGVICPRCQEKEPRGRVANLGVLSLLNQLAQGRIALDKFRINQEMSLQLQEFLADYINYINGKEFTISIG